MFNLDKFIADSVTFRPVSMFALDIEANKEKLTLKMQRKLCCKVLMAISSVRKMDKYFYASEVKSNA